MFSDDSSLFDIKEIDEAVERSLQAGHGGSGGRGKTKISFKEMNDRRNDWNANGLQMSDLQTPPKKHQIQQLEELRHLQQMQHIQNIHEMNELNDMKEMESMMNSMGNSVGNSMSHSINNSISDSISDNITSKKHFKIKILNKDPEVILVKNFMTPSECDYVINLG